MATRRRFIRDCSALAASAAFLPPSVLAAPRRWREVSLANVAFGTLAELVRSTFVVRDASGSTQALELVEAEPALSADSFEGGDDAERFSLIFRGDLTRALSQKTYVFDHSRIGRFEMFIVPVGREDRSGCYYEAVFNRPPPGSHARCDVAGRPSVR